MISDGIDLIKFVWIGLGSQAGSDFCILTISLKIFNMGSHDGSHHWKNFVQLIILLLRGNFGAVKSSKVKISRDQLFFKKILDTVLKILSAQQSGKHFFQK